MEPLLNGERIPLWRPILAEEGSMLCFGKVKTGCRAYVTFAGGIYIDAYDGKQKYLHTCCDWWYGRENAEKGDYFQLGKDREMAHPFMQDLQKGERIKTKWAISSSVLPKYKKYPKLRVITGFEYDRFTEESKKAFLRKYKVSNYADRMGYRVEGEILNRAVEKEILSSQLHMEPFKFQMADSRLY